jgi:putative SOS response-associated peptidase YedK
VLRASRRSYPAVPVSGFYELRRPEPGSPSLKQPFYFHQADDEPLVFAGLWDLWLAAEGRPLRSCTIITTAANRTMAPIHHRMPVVLPLDVWLGAEPLAARRLAELLAPAPMNPKVESAQEPKLSAKAEASCELPVLPGGLGASVTSESEPSTVMVGGV